MRDWTKDWVWAEIAPGHKRRMRREIAEAEGLPFEPVGGLDVVVESGPRSLTLDGRILPKEDMRALSLQVLDAKELKAGRRIETYADAKAAMAEKGMRFLDKGEQALHDAARGREESA